jgi:hypothetical protein
LPGGGALLDDDDDVERESFCLKPSRNEGAIWMNCFSGAARVDGIVDKTVSWVSKSRE